jgi:N,N-dimethylformamidase
MSYLAYANDHVEADLFGSALGFDIRDHYQAEDHYAAAVPLTGLYDRHPDGSGVCYSSWRRPIVNMRPHYYLPISRCAHQFSADLHLIDWLEEKGVRYDVISDHDLHEEGGTLLSHYRVMLTGTHPEYWTDVMLAGLEAYLCDGGRLMYLGGNGFYWVTSVSPSRPYLIEVRRGRRGTGTWRSEPGEDFHSTTGELGGLWRDRGRAPQRLVSVGMTAQGHDRARPYSRGATSCGDEVDWIFKGVEGTEIQCAGLVLDGPAGFELDRLDYRLGTPANAVLLATASGFSDSYQHVVEEVAVSDSRQGGSVSPDVRADLVYTQLEGGGAVFSAGSISWCGCLSENDYDNPISVITWNVLREFSGK